MKTPQLVIPTLTTNRLRLEPLAMSHSAGMYETWRHVRVQEYSGVALDKNGVRIDLPAQSSQESDRLIRFWLQAAVDGWGFRWAVILQGEAAFVGHIGFNTLGPCSEIAYHMNPAFWGRGLMSEAAAAAIDWRREKGTTEIEAFIESGNVRSIALARRLGLEPTDQYSEGARRYRKAI